MSYRELADWTGGKHLARITQFFICVNLLGTCIGYLVAGADLVPMVFLQMHPDNTQWYTQRSNVLAVLVLCIVWPLALMRNLGSLRFTSLFAIACIVFLTIATIWKYFAFEQSGIAPSIAFQFKHLPWFPPHFHNVLTALPLVIFAYTCHPNVRTIKNKELDLILYLGFTPLFTITAPFAYTNA